jgi:hypothetical protein
MAKKLSGSGSDRMRITTSSSGNGDKSGWEKADKKMMNGGKRMANSRWKWRMENADSGWRTSDSG